MIYYICYIVYKLCAIYNKYAIYIYIPGNMIYIYIYKYKIECLFLYIYICIYICIDINIISISISIYLSIYLSIYIRLLYLIAVPSESGTRSQNSTSLPFLEDLL